jgi:hypothetical protein
MSEKPEPTGWPNEIAQHLGGIFRHMLPGILVIAGARVAHPEWFSAVSVTTWQNVVVLGAVSIAVGNAWFALNRYGLHQLVDYGLYLIKSNGPARGEKWWRYLDDLGQYTYKSLHTPDTCKRARQHVEFRASAVLLALTVGELLVAFQIYHATDSLFTRHPHLWIAGAIAFMIGLWQMVITRRIDFYVVNPPKP